MNARLQSTWSVIKDALGAFSEDKVPTLGAALAYYTIFSVAPLLIIALAIAAWAFGAKASSGEIFSAVADLVGKNGAQSIQDMVESANKAPTTGVFSTIVGIVTLLVGATGVFGQLQDSLNLIWRVQAIPGRSIATIFRQRFLSLTIVVVFAFLLMISLVVTAGLAAMGKYFNELMPASAIIWQIANLLVSFLVITALFAAIFKVLPDVNLAWSDVWRGSAITAVLFTLGKFLIGEYLGRTGVTSSYGAAGSLIGVLLWVYYSSTILLLGVEITRAYVRQAGHKVTPKPHAEFRPELDAAKDQKAPVAKT